MRNAGTRRSRRVDLSQSWHAKFRARAIARVPAGAAALATPRGVFELMREVGRTSGTSFLLVTQNLDLARRCDRIIEVVDGHVVS
jgi:predicted ABC-type transport system involved in lysophospholipase L1 biosynthesis ATPase subunit